MERIFLFWREKFWFLKNFNLICLKGTEKGVGERDISLPSDACNNQDQGQFKAGSQELHPDLPFR